MLPAYRVLHGEPFNLTGKAISFQEGCNMPSRQPCQLQPTVHHSPRCQYPDGKKKQDLTVNCRSKIPIQMSGSTYMC
ncbi:hypothetical protein HBI56_075320 [Parastagonospora nodorum]|uniref:Uncharacterized protein n=1 Tax=Phaeosphaeria nodorum (strain SN15 / ATCC MYA-4574 / FGSC 10173) TaxID=321614 RepID=A0A7U2EYS5_PHANO|nr:hypothetical protein HBH56_169670 [Parastagonospora nodorum]QRC94383.1 hypothetical protein JI435_305440 [Parastagonospora nodorum SN15]KAH3928633.1 hypothetical protein HBH54_138220 [Parastagonospora nodorum]KAH3945289.1 hypothetical protein HBH53_143570 [Parastagonospora nodorum]KAH3984058.1 hypothetical protein HBH52_060650 [Parastagonospora nodorum]